MRVYLQALEKKIKENDDLDANEFKSYIEWTYGQTDILDPLNGINDLKKYGNPDTKEQL